MAVVTQPTPQPIVVLTVGAVATLRANANDLEGDAEAQLGVGPNVLLG
jgi:hypothetical protein